MILQALTAYYDALVQNGTLQAPGWSPAKIGVALYLSDDGELEQAVSIKVEALSGEKKTLVPQVINLPAPVKRTVGISPNFLWDNSSYILGFDGKGKPERSKKCFAACKQHHEALLAAVDSPCAKAILAFFDRWNPDAAQEHPALANCMEDLLGGANIVFRCNAGFPHDDPLIRAAWQQHFDVSGDGPKAVCLVTGERCEPEAVHPSIKGIKDAQSSGAALVSFNAPAFCSYGKEQSLNAPVGKRAAFAYAAALNHLIGDREHVHRIGDTTVLCWAKNGAAAYQDAFGFSLFDDAYTEGDLREAVKKLSLGQWVTYDNSRLDPDMDFYVLGISPNAARLSVRFFMHNRFGDILRNIQAHYDRLEIVRPAYDKREHLALWSLLNETVNQNARDKSASRVLAGEMLRSVLFGLPYPATLLNGVTLRIRAEHEITRGRAAILKAYYLKNAHSDVPKEVLQVALNPDSTNVPYTLGRLFSVLEDIQLNANPGINTTIKDKYFSSASATPGVVFPTLVNLAQKHLKKLEPGRRIHFEKQWGPLFSKLGETYPARMNLAQQGAFQLGYYHQTQQRYTKQQEEE